MFVVSSWVRVDNGLLPGVFPRESGYPSREILVAWRGDAKQTTGDCLGLTVQRSIQTADVNEAAMELAGWTGIISPSTWVSVEKFWCCVIQRAAFVCENCRAGGRIGGRGRGGLKYDTIGPFQIFQFGIN